MKDSYFKIVLTALAEKIDRLCGEIFVRDLEIENLKDENKTLREALDVAKKVIEVAEDGKL